MLMTFLASLISPENSVSEVLLMTSCVHESILTCIG